MNQLPPPLWHGLLTVPPGLTAGLPKPVGSGRRPAVGGRGTVRRPCHNACSSAAAQGSTVLGDRLEHGRGRLLPSRRPWTNRLGRSLPLPPTTMRDGRSEAFAEYINPPTAMHTVATIVAYL